MNQLRMLYRNALDRLTPVLAVPDRNQKREALYYVFNSMIDNQLLSVGLNQELKRLRESIDDDEYIGYAVSSLQQDINRRYDRLDQRTFQTGT